MTGEISCAVHQASMERIIGRIFTVVAVEYVLEFWFTTNGVRGASPASLAADLLLSLLLLAQGLRAIRRPPTQPDLCAMVALALLFLPVSRLLAVPGSAFLHDGAYLLAVPIAIAWAALASRLVIPVLVLLVAAATGIWPPVAAESVAATVTTLATATFAAVAIRILRAGAREADATTERTAHQMASEAAALAAEEAERWISNAVHDSVLSVLRAVSQPQPCVPWSELVNKAGQALTALSGRSPGPPKKHGALTAALFQQARETTASLTVRCDLDGDLDVPPDVTEAISAAAGEALRNAAVHSKAPAATVTARSDGSGGIKVTICDRGVGFDPARVGPASSGLCGSIRARMRDAGGHAEITSSPGAGTRIILTWAVPAIMGSGAIDPLAWGRRFMPRAQVVFLGFMLPQLLSSLVLLILGWHQLRWPAVGVIAYAGLFILTTASARNVSQMRMPRRSGVILTATAAALVAAGTFAVAPGTTNLFVYWVALESAILVGVMVLLRGVCAGLVAMTLDISALSAGLLAGGDAMPVGGWVSVLASPVLGAGAGFGFLIALRSFAGSAERQLGRYHEQLRHQARTAAMRWADATALDRARQVAGPVLSQVAAGQLPCPQLRTAARMADAELRDHLLAPGLLTPALIRLIRGARERGARITVRCAPTPQGSALVQPAQQLLAAALHRADSVAELTLDVHPVTQNSAAMLIMHLRSRPGHPDHRELHESASRHGALVSCLTDQALLIRLRADPPPVNPRDPGTAKSRTSKARKSAFMPGGGRAGL